MLSLLVLALVAGCSAAPHRRSVSATPTTTPLRNGRTSNPSQQVAQRPQFARDDVDAGYSLFQVYKPLGSASVSDLGFYVAPQPTQFGHRPLQLLPKRHAKRKGAVGAGSGKVDASSTTYTTSSIAYATPAGASATPYVTSMQVNGIDIQGTFNGQQSPFLPSTPFMPGSATSSNRSYSNLLGLSFLFYEEQRLGLLSSPRRTAWRNSSALHDGLDHGIDLTGGWADAGDYLNSTLSLMTWGCADNWRGVKAAGQLGYLDQTVRWAFDWLIKANPNPQTLYVQVGDADLDNNSWNRDTNIVEPRPSYAITNLKPGTDVAAGTAAAFASGAVLYATVFNNQSYALTLLEKATQLYYLAESTPKRLYQVSVPAVKESYASSSWEDELVWGALRLWRATQNDYFLNRASLYANKYDLGGVTDPVSWDSKHGAALLLGAQLQAQFGKNNSAWSQYDWRGQLDTYMDAQLKTRKTSGGLLWYGDSSNDASLVVAINTAYLCSQYARSFAALKDVATMTRVASCRKLMSSQLDYVFGNNPRSRVYMVGAHLNAPKNPQSAMAAGGGDIDSIDTTPKQEAYVLFGAVVGGPDKNDGFKDQRSNWQQSEPALDYNALLTPLLAAQINEGASPFYARSSLGPVS